MVVKLEQRIKNEEAFDDITVNLTYLDILGTDSLIEIRDRSPGQIEVTLDLGTDDPRNAVSVRPLRLSKAIVRDVTVGLLAMALMAFFHWAGLPLVILLIIAVLMGYYFGRGYIALR
jgi:hypothetical protein